jgi:pseudaminic acid cytidylyltransferase
VIPARGGSRRLPGKNIREFCGRPMIGWPIAAALRARFVDRVIVSTDSPEIADVAREFGAEVPFLRPPELSDEHTGTAAVVRHVLGVLCESGDPPSAACCIYATAALVQAADIDEGCSLLDEGDWDYVFTAQRFAHPVQRAFELDARGAVRLREEGYTETRSQDITPAYHDAGQWYWGTTSAWRAGTALFGARSRAFLLDANGARDIDNADDWLVAEALFRALGHAG